MELRNVLTSKAATEVLRGLAPVNQIIAAPGMGIGHELSGIAIGLWRNGQGWLKGGQWGGSPMSVWVCEIWR